MATAALSLSLSRSLSHSLSPSLSLLNHVDGGAAGTLGTAFLYALPILRGVQVWYARSSGPYRFMPAALDSQQSNLAYGSRVVVL